jgi:4-aminobutyrate aminotransferase-like enzyme
MRDEYSLPSTLRYFPIPIVKREMQFVFDETGKKYLDAFSAVVNISDKVPTGFGRTGDQWWASNNGA